MFCGIDLGTSSVKASVFDEQGDSWPFPEERLIWYFHRQGWRSWIQRIIW